MARPNEIDGKIVARMRDLSRMPWEAIATALNASRSGVITAYKRIKRNAKISPADKIRALREAMLGLNLGPSWCWCVADLTGMARTAHEPRCESARDAMEMSE